MSPVDVAPPAVPSQTPLSSIKRKKKKNFKNRTSLAPAAVMDVDVDAVVNDGEAIALLVPDEVDDLLPSSPATTTPPASLSLKKLAGGKLGQCKIIFTKDSRFFFCAAGKNLKVYNVSTGQVVRTLSSNNASGGHSDTITTLALNPSNHLQLFSSSMDGTLKLWDFNEGTLLKTWPTGFPIVDFSFLPTCSNSVILSLKSLKKGSIQIVKLNLAQGETKEQALDVIQSSTNVSAPLLKISRNEVYLCMNVSFDGSYLVAATPYSCVVYNFESHERTVFEMEHEITTMALHPNEHCIATGDVNGKIVMWYFMEKTHNETLSSSSAKPISTTLHWHAHRVLSLAFTMDGSYLLSGGEEGVLVLWQLQTRHKDFLPRLGSHIVSISVSPDQTLMALGHQDNTIRIASTVNMTVKQAVMGLKCAQVDHDVYPLSTGLVVEPRNDHIVLNGVPGTLQFYNCFTDRHVLEMDVTPRNKISRREDKEISSAHVSHVAFSKDGEWMASIDKREEDEVDTGAVSELYLKFWSYDHDLQSFIVNTRIDMPHADQITSLALCPNQNDPDLPPIAVTCSLDKTFKIWELHTAQSSMQDTHWSCRSVGFYKDSPAHCAAFSSDGSILAVAYGQVLTLWNPYRNSIEKVLAYHPPAMPIRELLFLQDSPYLVARSDSSIYVWNLLTCTVAWFLDCYQPLRVIAFPSSPEFLLLSKLNGNKSRIHIFSPGSESPLHSYELESGCISAAVLPKRIEDLGGNCKSNDLFDKSFVLLLNDDYEFDILDTIKNNNSSACDSVINEIEDMANATQKTLFSDIYGKLTIQSESLVSASTQPEPLPEVSESTPFLTIPTNVLPHPSVLIQSFLSTLLVKKATPQPSSLLTDSSREIKSEDNMEEVLVPSILQRSAILSNIYSS